jgi:hypothetical protein
MISFIANSLFEPPVTKALLYISLCFFAMHVRAQPNYEKISDRFLTFYNDETPDSVYAMYSADLKEKIPIEKTRALFSGLHVQFGELRTLDLLKQDSGFNMYKASFSHQTLSLLLALTDDNLIEGFRLVPYDPAQFPDKKKSQ